MSEQVPLQNFTEAELEAVDQENLELRNDYREATEAGDRAREKRDLADAASEAVRIETNEVLQNAGQLPLPVFTRKTDALVNVGRADLAKKMLDTTQSFVDADRAAMLVEKGEEAELLAAKAFVHDRLPKLTEIARRDAESAGKEIKTGK